MKILFSLLQIPSSAPWFLSLAPEASTPARQANFRSFSSLQNSNEVKKCKKQSLKIKSFAKHYESVFWQNKFKRSMYKSFLQVFEVHFYSKSKEKQEKKILVSE